MLALRLLPLLLLGFVSSARADIPPPQPVHFTVTGLGEHKEYNFFYAAGDYNPPARFEKIKSDKQYAVRDTVRLFVGVKGGKLQEFARFPFELERSTTHVIAIKGVTAEGDKLKVSYDVVKGGSATGSGAKPPRSSSYSLPVKAIPYFLLAGLCASALYLRRPKRIA